MSNRQARCNLLGKGSEVFSRALPQGFQSFEACLALGGMNANAFGIEVVHRDKHRRFAFFGRHRRGHVCTPYLIGMHRGDRPIMCFRPMTATYSLRSL